MLRRTPPTIGTPRTRNKEKRTLGTYHEPPSTTIMLYLVVSTPRPERPSELAKTRQSFWPWMAKYEASGVCRHIYARVGRGAVAILDVESNEALHRILNEWADIIAAHFDIYPLVDVEAAKRMLASQVAAKK
jgi:muconolactone delta-isomerase